MSNEHNFVFCATNWYGFSQTEIVPSVFGFFDLSNARVPFDTTQQGVLNMLMLGRAMQSAKGFGSNAAFQMGTTRAACSTPASCSTTATARAASSAAC